jgi:DNA-binding NarL/FixJ family response regulator
MEIALPLIDGIAAARRIRMVKPSTEILFIAASHNEDQVRAAFEAGGRGFLLKDSDFDELFFAVKKTAIGEYYISGVAGPEMVAAYVQSRIAEQRPGGFMTRREREIAKLLSDGYSTKEVADILSISVKTAETHRASIMKKLNAKNVTDIVKYCIRNRIIEL